MTIVMHDLCGEDESRRFSPYCWRVRMALAHKGLGVDARATPFTRIGNLPDGRRMTLPTIQDGDTALAESWDIAAYLEREYPDRPPLFAGSARSLANFVRHWTETVMHPGIVGFVLLDVHDHLAPADQAYFRENREKRFKRTLEEVQAGRDERLPEFRRSLAPLRNTLGQQPFLCGERPGFADYMPFGALQWARSISRFRILADDDPIKAWFERCLDLYDGLARRAPGYD